MNRHGGGSESGIGIVGERVDTPFELRIEPRLRRLASPEEGRAFVRFYILLSRAEPFGGYGERFGADLDLEGIAEPFRAGLPVLGPPDGAAFRFLVGAIAALRREGLLRSGPCHPAEPFRATGFTLTPEGEAWLAEDGA